MVNDKWLMVNDGTPLVYCVVRSSVIARSTCEVRTRTARGFRGYLTGLCQVFHVILVIFGTGFLPKPCPLLYNSKYSKYGSK